MNWIYRGRCWKFGDNLGIDGDIMPFRFALAREMNPEVLRDHLMTAIDPDFPSKVTSGDIIVAGKRFGQGNPHIQGFLGIRGLGLGLVVESIPRGSFRNAINAGVPFLSGCRGILDNVETGDRLEVNFCTGEFSNISREFNTRFPPLDRQLLDIIAEGGWRASLEKRLKHQRAKQPALQ